MPQVSGNLYHCQKLSSHFNSSSLRITSEPSLYYPHPPYSISDFNVSEELPSQKNYTCLADITKSSLLGTLKRNDCKQDRKLHLLLLAKVAAGSSLEDIAPDPGSCDGICHLWWLLWAFR
jgi:hypothetical protein